MCCDKTFVTASTIDVDTATVVIVPDQAVALDNYEKVVIKLLTTPAGGATFPATITVNGAAVPVYDKAGNVLYGNQLYSGMVIMGYFGSAGAGGTAHLQLINYPYTGKYCYNG